MKEILLKIDDEVFESLKSSLVTKHISGSMYGVIDEFIIILVKSIESGLKEKTIKLK